MKGVSGTALALTTLTLNDLLFVASTAAVGGEAMTLLLGAAAAAPWLRRFQGRRWYFVLWTLVVMAAFGRLVFDFLRYGPPRLLEDGLILAATSQVHLLYNVGHKQEPDLLFLNSFTIVLVSSFFAPGLTFSLLLVVYAVVLLHAMRTAALGDAAVQPAQELPLAAMTLALTALLFAGLPRSFDRPGLPLSELPLMSSVREAGFTPEVDLTPRGRIAQNPKLVLVVERSAGELIEFPAYWRGATAVLFDGVRWDNVVIPGGSPGADPTWKMVPDWEKTRWESDRTAHGPAFRVAVHEVGRGRLCLPPETAEIGTADGLQLLPLPDGTFGVLGHEHLRPPLRLEISLARPRTLTLIAPSVPWTQAHTSLPAGLSPWVRLLADQARRRTKKDATSRDRARAVAALLQEQHRYLLPGEPGAAESLGEFLAPGGAGHCELFATSAALMLRALGIPCRIVTGYRSGERDGEDRLQIRRLHAHAWVEAFDPATGWWELDATPAATVVDQDAHWWTSPTRSLGEAWGSLLRFNEGNRRLLLAGLASLPARHPVRSTGVALLLGAFVAMLVLRRRGRVPVEVRRYERRARRLRKANETPRELLARAGGELLDAATARHEAARYRVPSRD